MNHLWKMAWAWVAAGFSFVAAAWVLYIILSPGGIHGLPLAVLLWGAALIFSVEAWLDGLLGKLVGTGVAMIGLSFPALLLSPFLMPVLLFAGGILNSAAARHGPRISGAESR